jgi:hypothetical protein
VIIHSNTLTADDLYDAARTIPGVYVDELSIHGSRDHARSFRVKLEGTGRQRNSGRWGADGSGQAATWDEHGAWMARVFDADPDARFGDKAHPIYQGREHFRWITGARFDQGMPEDAHAQHRWEHAGVSVGGSYAVAYCAGRKGKPCSAILRRVVRGSWEDIAHAMDWPTFADMV